MSSVVVIGNYKKVYRISVVLKRRVTDNCCSVKLRYSRIKLVCEHILANTIETYYLEM